MDFIVRDILMMFTTLMLFEVLIAQVTAEQCYVFNKVERDSMKQRVGQSQWKNSCNNGTYVKAVWAEFPTEHFQKWKCCDSGVAIDSWSWEIRDLNYLSGGSNVATKPWKVECAKYSVITAFRYIYPDSNGLRILSGVRCSILKNKIANTSVCTTLNFNQPVTNASSDATNVSGNTTWQHECPDGYALTGLYDDNGFKNVHKGKCCRLDDFTLTPGKKEKNLGPTGVLSESDESDVKFQVLNQGKNGVHLRLMQVNKPMALARLVTPTFRKPNFCLQIHANSYGKHTLHVKIMTETSRHSLFNRELKNGNNNIYIDSDNNTFSQLYIDIILEKNIILQLTSIKVLDESSCSKVDQCKYVADKKTPLGCSKYEVCLPEKSVMKCQCDSTNNFTKNEDGICVCKDGLSLNRTTETCQNSSAKSGNSAGGFVFNTTSAPNKQTESLAAISTTVTSNTSNEGISRIKIPQNKELEPWVYSIAGLASGIVFIALISGIYLGYQKIIKRKKNRRASFSVQSIELDRFQSEVSLQNTTTRECNNSMYIPYMNNLGSVEHLSTSSPRNSFLNAPPNTYIIDPTTGEAEYARVNRTFQYVDGDCNVVRYGDTRTDRNSNMELTHLDPTFLETGHPIYSRINGINQGIPTEEKQEEDLRNYVEDVFQMDDLDVRRPSCMTLIQPEYGDENNDGKDDGIEQFIIPGDDEEELLNDLVELSPERVRISSKILGQGAFGLVKLGQYYSSSSIQDVAVKILKQRTSTEVTQEDRIIFYQEAAIMSQFDHPNVVTLFGVMVGKVPCMVLEHMGRGSLWKYLTRIGRIREKKAIEDMNRDLHVMFLKMARDIVAGMAYLAGLKFVHRDLATRNVLLDSRMNCKIGDFGLSRHFLKDDTYYTSRGGQIPVKWTAPEALQYKRYSTQSDVWSFGIVLWEIWSIGKRPYASFNNDKVIEEVCVNGYRLPEPDQVPIIIYRLMMDCWKENKNDRPTFAQLKFCLDFSNDRLLGSSFRKTKVERTRSITISHYSDDFCDHETNLIKNESEHYCKTE